MSYAHPSQVDALTLLVDIGFVLLFRGEQRRGKVLANVVGKPANEFLRILGLLVDRDPETESEFGVIFEKRIRPSWAASVRVLRPWRRREIAAVNRRAAGCVRHHGAIAK